MPSPDSMIITRRPFAIVVVLEESSADKGWVSRSGGAKFSDSKPADEAAPKPAFPATSAPKVAILSSPVTHPNFEGKEHG